MSEMSKFAFIDPNIRDGISALTERQRQCILLVSKGFTSKEIARSLNISPSTVDNHIRAVIVQIGAVNRVDAARIVEEWDRINRLPELRIGSDDALVEADKKNVHSKRSRKSWLKLPPIGGKSNKANISDKFKQIIQISVLGLMLFSALVATIAGLISLLPR